MLPRLVSPVRSAPSCATLVAACLFTALGLTGCDPPAPRRPADASTGPSSSGGSTHLDSVFALVDQLDETPEERVMPELLFHLNQWSEQGETPEKWQVDPLVERLPRNLKQFYDSSMFAKKEFDAPDVNHLVERIFLRDVGDWAVKQPSDERLEAWIRSPASELQGEQADQLTLALRLFDWTVRNIQLDALLPYPKEDVAGPTGAGEGGVPQDMPAPLKAQPGPGYQREPWQTLLVGHGDAIERARIFGLLARQHQIDVALLAISDVKRSSRPIPWACAVLIGERMYLFDTALGLPLPGPDDVGIATFEQLRRRPEMLDRLHAGDDLRYGVAPSDLEHVVALVDASPASLLLRMQRLEAALVGRNQLKLTSRPSALADRLRKQPGVNGASILTTGWEAPLYRAGLNQLAQVNPQAAQQAIGDELIFREVNPVAQGRRKHLRGEFESVDRDKGAKAHYVAARIPDDVIGRLAQDEEIQKQLGLIRPPGMSDQAWGARLAVGEYLFREAKMHASYWLGLVQYDTGHPDAAVDWFKARTLEADRPTRWKPGARYNLARCYERTGRSLDARLLYLDDDSPQKLGNRLRAQALARQEQAAQKPPAKKPAENKPPENKPVENKPVENKPVENKPPEAKPE